MKCLFFKPLKATFGFIIILLLAIIKRTGRHFIAKMYIYGIPDTNKRLKCQCNKVKQNGIQSKSKSKSKAVPALLPAIATRVIFSKNLAILIENKTDERTNQRSWSGSNGNFERTFNICVLIR